MQQTNPQPSSHPQPPPPQKNTVQQITVIKRSKISYYPYYPITSTLSQNGFGYIFNLQPTIDDYMIIIHPFKLVAGKEKGRDDEKDRFDYVMFKTVMVELDGVPRRNVNLLEVLEYQDFVNGGTAGTNKTVTVKLLDFVLGFTAGFLIRCRYVNSAKSENSHGKKQFSIISKFNKRPDYKQGFMMRMTSTFFGSDEFYKVAIDKPVRNFQAHSRKNQPKDHSQKYNYSYLIGNRLYLCKQFSEQIQSEALRTFNQVEWHQLPEDSLAKLNKMNSIVINSKRHKSLISSSYMLIEWVDQIAAYIYTSQNELIISDNEQNKILIFDLNDNLKLKSIYNFDLDIKKLTYQKSSISGKQQTYLLIMPYDNTLYLFNLTKSQVVYLGGHRSYITQAILNQSGMIVTGGCDHRIGLKNVRNVKEWVGIGMVKGVGSEKGTKYYEVNSSRVMRCKMDQIYFLGEFNNVNSERNNNNGFGFGNFLRIQGSQLYAFITYDFSVKVYKILV